MTIVQRWSCRHIYIHLIVCIVREVGLKEAITTTKTLSKLLDQLPDPFLRFSYGPPVKKLSNCSNFFFLDQHKF